jgi:Tol biopolymer transport system component
MSPEQVRGEVLDIRSDLFSFGLVLYEMATGRLAFPGETAAAVFAAILHEAPSPAKTLNPALPEKLDEIISKALEKDRTLRYQHAAKILTDLKRLSRDMGLSAPGSNSDHASVAIDSVRKGHDRKLRSQLLLATLLFLVATIGYLTYTAVGRRVSPPFLNYSVLEVTYGRDAKVTGISPDGKFVATAKKGDNGLESLWLHNIATNTDIQISPGEMVGNGCIDFSPDGNFIFVCKGAANSRNIYRGPVLGGSWQLIAKTFDSAGAVSPDGKHIAYMRSDCPQAGQWCVIETDLENGQETVLFAENGTNRPDDYGWPPPGVLAWSPDGKRLAVAVTQIGNASAVIKVIETKTGSSKVLFSVPDKQIRTLNWLPDGRGFLVNFAAKDTPHRWQIGWLSYPEGNFRAVTNDTNTYYFDRTSSDGRSLAAAQTEEVRTLYLLPGTGSDNRSSPAATLPVRNLRTFSWDHDGSLLLSGDGKFVRVGIDGKQETSLLRTPGNLTARAPVPCDEGRYLVFEWDHKGGAKTVSLWRMNSDGSNLVQLTTGADGEDPVCAERGKWVYYVDATRPQPMRIPVYGGQAEPVPGSMVPNGSAPWGNIGLSPDGERLVYLTKVKLPGGASTQLKAVIVNLAADGREPPRIVDVDQQIAYPPQFTPDGKGIAYPIWENGLNSIWVQPLNDQPRQRITTLSDQVREFFWSPSGDTLGILRTRGESNVVVLTDSSSLR